MAPSEIHKIPAPAEDRMSIMFRWSGVEWAEAWMDVWTESQGFVSERLREDVLTWHEILHSRTPADALAAQMRGFRKAVEDYRAEAGRIAQLLKAVPGAQEAMD